MPKHKGQTLLQNKNARLACLRVLVLTYKKG